MGLNNFRTEHLIWDRVNSHVTYSLETNSGDSNGRKLRVQVLDGGVVTSLTGVTLSLAWKTANQRNYGLDAFKLADAALGIFEIYYTTEMLSNVGKLKASLVLVDATGRMESDTFPITVNPTMVDDNAVQGENSFTALTEALVNISNVKEQLEQKADKSQIGAPTQTQVSTWLTQNPQATTTVQDGAITAPKISKNAVTPDKISSDTQNLLTHEILDNYWISGSPLVINPNTEYALSNYVKAVEGETFTISSDRPSSPVAIYNSSGEITRLIGAGNTDDSLSKPYTFQIPTGGVGFRVTIKKSVVPLSEYTIGKGSNVVTLKQLDWLSVSKSNLQRGAVDTDILADGIINANKLKLDVTNLLVKETLIKDSYIGGPIGAANPISNPKYDATPPIPVVVGERYTVSADRPSTVAYGLDTNGVSVQAYTSGNSSDTLSKPFTFTITNPDVKTIQVTIAKTIVPLDEFIIAKASDFDALRKVTIPWLLITKDNLSSDLEFPVQSGGGLPTWYTPKKGKTLVTFGNSRTWYDGKVYGTGTKEAGKTVKGYQTYIREQLGMNIVNVGVSGSRIHQTVDLLKSYVFIGDEYAISLMQGTNNFNAVAGGEVGYSLGTVDHAKSGGYNVMSYAGGLQEFVEWVSINKPGLKMYLITDAWCFKGSYGGMDREYSDIMREVAELYHYPFLDLYHMCGFNENNMNEYFVDAGSSLFHENTKGYERTSEIIVPFIANH